MSSFVVFDLEFTTWPGALEQDWSEPGQLREITQIGALRLREDCSVIEEYEALVKPVTNPELSSYFTGLTGITQESVDRDGIPPVQALSEFLGFSQGHTVLSYGNDMVVLGENLGWSRARGEQLKHSMLDAAFVNIRPWINAVAPPTATANVGRLWEVLDLPRPHPGQEHSALFDCHSFAVALAHLSHHGADLPAGIR